MNVANSLGYNTTSILVVKVHDRDRSRHVAPDSEDVDVVTFQPARPHRARAGDDGSRSHRTMRLACLAGSGYAVLAALAHCNR